jgi:histidinol-phosphatase (PHP family)
MLFNYHTHTKRCNHAIGEDREYVESAIQAGIKTLGFSDHAPYLFPYEGPSSMHRVPLEQAEEYVSSIRALAKEYANEIRILCGFELEYFPLYHQGEMIYLQQFNPDYLILGQHFLGDEKNGKSPYVETDKDLKAYVSQLLEGLQTGDFLYLAHPDMAGYKVSEKAIEREYRRLCEGAKALNVPVELNLLGIRGNRWYPRETFFRIAAEVGNKVLLGTDAHSPEAFSHPTAEQTALDMVKKLGLPLLENPIL